MLRQFWLVLGVLAGCASAPIPLESRPWPPIGYQGFAESIDALAGPEAIDCGFLNALEPKGTWRRRSQALRCIREATRRSLPFKFATARIPIDSFAHEVMVRTPDGKFWMIVYDVMVDGSAPQQWNRVCESISIDPETLYLTGEGCVEHSTGKLQGS